MDKNVVITAVALVLITTMLTASCEEPTTDELIERLLKALTKVYKPSGKPKCPETVGNDKRALDVLSRLVKKEQVKTCPKENYGQECDGFDRTALCCETPFPGYLECTTEIVHV